MSCAKLSRIFLVFFILDAQLTLRIDPGTKENEVSIAGRKQNKTRLPLLFFVSRLQERVNGNPSVPSSSCSLPPQSSCVFFLLACVVEKTIDYF